MESQSDNSQAQQISYGTDPLAGVFNNVASYDAQLQGSWGEFNPGDSDHRVLFLNTSARLSANVEAAGLRAAVQHLRPVRELLDISTLKFKELLQRDLDDHRVAHELVPYLLGDGQARGAKFFPPVLAILLPDAAMGGKHQIPEIREGMQTLDGQPRFVTEAEPLFRLRRVATGEGLPSHSAPYGALEWNTQAAKLVVIDGQHRLMALLALFRTAANSWPQGQDQYRRLYQDAVMEAINRAGGIQKIPTIEMPVTILMFPSLHGERTPDIYAAARKLFVDVNKGAKRPTMSRLILLSDDDLSNVLVRELLEAIRDEDRAIESNDLGSSGYLLPELRIPLLPGVEYDASSSNVSSEQLSRDTRLLSVVVLKTLIEYMCLRNPRLAKKLEINRERDEPRFDYLSKRLQLQSHLGQVLEIEIEGRSVQIQLDDLHLNNCPEQVMNKISTIFLGRYGRSISMLLRGIKPYSHQLQALQDVKPSLNGFGSVGRLVEEALFAGSGTAFVLEKIRDEYKKSPHHGKDAEEAWTLLDKTERLFRDKLMGLLLGSESDEDRRSVNDLRSQTSTTACLIGLVMTFAHLESLVESTLGLGDHERLSDDEVASLTHIFISKVNEAQTGQTESGAERSLILSKKPVRLGKGLREVEPYNLLGQLTPRLWVEFRCLWLGLLMTDLTSLADSIVAAMPKRFTSNEINELKSQLLQSKIESNKILVEYLTKEAKRAAINLLSAVDKQKESKKKAAENAATHEMLQRMFNAQVEWFGLSEEQFKADFGVIKESGIWAQ